MRICMVCEGEGIIHALLPIDIKITCELCEGTGQISEERIKWFEEGKKLRERRLSRNLTLKNAAKRLGIDILILSKMERGIIEPDKNLFI